MRSEFLWSFGPIRQIYPLLFLILITEGVANLATVGQNDKNKVFLEINFGHGAIVSYSAHIRCKNVKSYNIVAVKRFFENI